MAFYTGTTATTNSYRDFLVSIVAAATSKHVSAAVVNAGGSGYVVGDTITISHASGHLDLVLEVTGVSSGAVTTVRINSAGAFANRVASVSVNSGGTGYAVDDYIEIQGGTATEKAKAQVTSVSGGVVTGISLIETGGAYSTLPGLTGLSTVGIGPSGYGGNDDLTVDITTQAIIGTTGIAQTSTSGSGTGATFDLTLTDTGWTALRNDHDFDFNSIDEEKEVVLQGDGGSNDDPIIGIRSYTQTSGLDTFYGLALYAMTSFNSNLEFSGQQGIGPQAGVPDASGAYVPMLEGEAFPYYFAIDDRRVTGVVKNDDTLGGGSVVSYASFYLGFANAFGSSTENPYPMVVGGCSGKSLISAISSETTISSLVECSRGQANSGPVFYYRWGDNSYVEVANVREQFGSLLALNDHTMYPFGQPRELSGNKTKLTPNNSSQGIKLYSGIGSQDRSSQTRAFRPAPGSTNHMIVPLIIQSTPTGGDDNTANDFAFGALSGVFWVCANKTSGNISAEDYFEDGSDRYRAFSTAALTLPYLFFCIKEE